MTHDETLYQPQDMYLPPLSELLGMRQVSLSRDEVIYEMPVTEKVGNRNGVLHGGALMSIGDAAGGTLVFLNINREHTTTTTGSHTSFLRPVRLGDTIRAHARLVKSGRTLFVVRTEIIRSDGKLCAEVTQDQLILKWNAEDKGQTQ